MSAPVRVAVRGVGAVAAVAILAVSFAACAIDARSAAPSTLDGTSWTAVLVGGEPTDGGTVPSVAFAATELTGTTGCNTLHGAYRYAGGTVAVEDLVATQFECQGRGGAVEERFLNALRQVSTASIDQDGQLVLKGDGGSLTFVVAGRQSGG